MEKQIISGDAIGIGGSQEFAKETIMCANCQCKPCKCGSN